MSRVVLRHFQESQTLRLMIEKGDLDIANNMAVSDINALRDDLADRRRGAARHHVPRGDEHERAHFANPKVREAVRYLIDQGINKALMPGYGCCTSGRLRRACRQRCPTRA